jgi:hypothetical protein
VTDRGTVQQAFRRGGALRHHKFRGALGRRLSAPGGAAKVGIKGLPLHDQLGWPRVPHRAVNFAFFCIAHELFGHRRLPAVARPAHPRPEAKGNATRRWQVGQRIDSASKGRRQKSKALPAAGLQGVRGAARSCARAPRLPGMRRGSTCLQTAARLPCR